MECDPWHTTYFTNHTWQFASKVEDVNLCIWFQKLQAKQHSSHCYNFGYVQISNDLKKSVDNPS
jgi:hypothetical protein